MDVIDKLNYISNKNNNVLSVLARYLISYDGEFDNLKIKYLCNQAHVSYATPTRLAKAIGLNGFSELRYELISSKRQNNNMVFNNQIDISNYIKKLNNSLNNSLCKITQKDLDFLSKIIDKYEKIKIYAIGQSFLIGLDLHGKLVRLNKSVTCPFFESEIYTSSKVSQEDDLIIAFSHSAKTKLINESLKRCVSNGSKVVMITSNKHYSLSNVIVYNLNLIEPQVSNISMISKTVFLIFIDLIFINLISKYPKYNKMIKISSMIK